MALKLAMGLLSALVLCSASGQAQAPDAAASEDYGAKASATAPVRPVRDGPAATVVLERDEIDRNPTLTTDSLLRALPSVATFRRSTSLTADPSSQGLNLRGIGPSGVSRTLVLVDGVPANDPFGGWIYWRALPRLGIGEVDVVPGGGSARYGSAALGGVVSFTSRSLEVPVLDADASYGSFETGLVGARVAGPVGARHGSLEAEWLGSSGYPVVADADRGPIDQAASSQHGNVVGRLELVRTRRLRVESTLGAFVEDQNGGTRFTEAGVRQAQGALSAQLDAGRAGNLALQLYGRATMFEQRRARVAEGRISEQLSASQRVPAHDQGATFRWQLAPRQAAGRHEVALGFDVRHVRGVSRERLFPPSLGAASVTRREAGGAQLLAGGYVEHQYTVAPWFRLDSALRFDQVRDFAGSQALTRGDGTRQRTQFGARTQHSLNPRVGLLVRPFSMLAVRGALYRAFRAATLNELYRPFQVGTVLTAANAGLRSERLLGGEAGLDVTPSADLQLRITGFWSALDDAVANVTLAEPRADGAGRERQNLGRTRVRGLESMLAVRVVEHVSVIVGYTFTDPSVQRGPEALRGKELAQAPRHRGSLQLSYDHPDILTANLQVRATSGQYEDDLNMLRMGGYALVDVMLARRIWHHVDGFVAIENLTNQAYLVGRAGIDTLGAPFFARFGLRVRDALR